MDLHCKINGKSYTTKEGETLLSLAERNNITIPTLCFHEKVETYGACGVCLVEDEKNHKLLRSCATMAMEGMSVITDSPKVIAARKIALELLFTDHRGDCRPPCVLACPAQTDCQGYVGLIANKQYGAALELIKEKIPIPASIGRICPHPCETACRRHLVEEPISIAQLKAFVADLDLKKEEPYRDEISPATGKHVAVVGAGPGGLTAAYFLAKDGHKVTVFEAMSQGGGMLRYGIPEYRLPKAILQQEIDLIADMGVNFHYGVTIGKDIPFPQLQKDYDAIYVSIGAWKSAPLGVDGQDSKGVIGGIDFLRDVHEEKAMEIGNRVAVVGGGNTAMDACRTAIRLGAKEVYVLYRRTREEMPAEDIEIAEAIEEGVDFRFLVAPLEVLTENGSVTAIRLQKMMLGEADASGRRRPQPIEGAEEILAVDTIIAAIGQKVAVEGIDLPQTKWHTIEAMTDTGATALKGVFAGGDAVNDGPGIAIGAVGYGKRSADAISRYLQGEDFSVKEKYLVKTDDLTAEDFADKESEPRQEITLRSAETRAKDFQEIVSGFDEKQAQKEAARCLECGCTDYFECKLLHYGTEYGVKPQRLSTEKRRRKEKTDHPFIERNFDKCILCGLCVRSCKEVVGIEALALVNRGFATEVQTAFHKPLAETNCISCGECVELCPTGALTEKWHGYKRLPLEEDFTISTCGYCSLGCQTLVATKENMVSRTLPLETEKLCVKGRFGANFVLDGDVLTTPLIHGEKATLEEAFNYFTTHLQEILKTAEPNEIAVAISDKLTYEAMAAANHFAKKAIGTKAVGCFNKKASGAAAVLGLDGGTTDLNTVKAADFILYAGTDLYQAHPVLAMDLQKTKGILAIYGQETSKLGDAAKYMVLAENNELQLLKELLAAVINKSKALPNIANAEELKSAFKEITVSETAEKIAADFLHAKNPVILYDEASLSTAAATLLCNIGLFSSEPKTLPLKPKCNSRALSEFSIADANIFEGKAYKALILLGENPDVLQKNGFLVVADTHITPAVKMADVAFPLANFLEEEGTYLNTEGIVKSVSAVRKGDLPYTNAALFNRFSQCFHIAPSKEDREISNATPQFSFVVPKEEPFFTAATPTDFTEILFQKYFLEKQ